MERIKRLSDELSELDARRAEVETEIMRIVKDIISEESKANPHGVRKLGANSFTVSSRVLLGHAWSQNYTNWEDAVKPLCGYLEKYPVTEWKMKLQELLSKEKNGEVTIETFRSYRGERLRDTTVIDAELVRRIIGKL